MDAVCVHADLACQVHALAAALHAINLYCATICAALICCCAPLHKLDRHSRQWRGQDIRGFASLILGAAWSCEAAAALLRPSDTVHLVAALMGPLSWIAAAVFHVALWTRRSAAPILYLAIYWMLEFVSTATVIWQHCNAGISTDHIEIYIQGVSLLMTLMISMVDCVCFYDEVTKRFRNSPKSGNSENICYKHNETHFYSKFSFFWLNSLLYKGYKAPLDPDYLGDLPEDERSVKYYKEFMKIYHDQCDTKTKQSNPSLLTCYCRKVWPNFYLAGILKLFGDLIAVIPPLGLAIIIQYIQGPTKMYDHNFKVTLEEFFGNGYVMLLIVTLALISQAFLSQNSTHMVTVEGTRLKTALQSMVYDKCMRLAPWSPTDAVEDEESPLLRDPEETTVTRSGLITNLVSQDTYNIMSCVWICHYIWAIPLKVAVILYLLYTKLGISAIIGCAFSVLLITPMQFYIGKKISDNSKGISKCTDHRISKMTEILQGMDVIKLYVWEDLFKEKILQLREVELKLLNKDSIYWSFLTFTTQISTILITVITFSVHYLVDANNHLTTVKVFAGLAFFNQLTVPLLILPVTVLMVIQAMVSTKRIGEFLELPESNNIREDSYDDQNKSLKDDEWRDSVIESRDSNEYEDKDTNRDEADDHESGDQFSDDEIFISSHRNEYVVRMKNATFSWGRGADDLVLEVDDLDISAGKLIMVVGTTGSGKSSLLSAILGEMYLYKGDVIQTKNCSMWYAGQPPWLLEGTVRDNIVMNSSWCQRKYGRVLRATGLRPDLQLLPEGDATRLGSHGAPLSGGQRIRVCIARALYSGARLLALDEPLGALDAALARHLVARALVPAARSGRTVIVATNRLELLHYADMVIAMEDGRVSGVGRIGSNGVDNSVARWARLASEARAAASRAGVGPPGGTARERSRLLRALSRTRFHSTNSDDTLIGITEAAGSHLLSEVPTCAGGSWRRRPSQRPRPALGRQLSSPPPFMYNYKWRPTVRRAVSVDESNTTLQREASMLRRWLKPRTTRTLTRWTPRTLRRLISTDSEAASEDNQINDVTDEATLEATQYSSLTLNGINSNSNTGEDNPDNVSKTEEILNECAIWDEYRRSCGWWGTAYWVAAAAAQALALAADYWLTYTTSDGTTVPDEQQSWGVVRVYAAWCGGGALLSGVAQAACACAGAAARRAIHDKLLHATLRASPQHHRVTPLGNALHRFSSDILVIDKKLPTAITRWAQLALLCTAAILVNAAVAPWSLLASIPAVFFYFFLQSIYLTNARELQSAEARSAASVVSLCAEACAGASTIRAGRLQTRMRTAFMRRLDANHNALLLLNSANRWLGLTLDLVGAGIVFVSLTVSVCGGVGGAGSAGLAGAYSLLLPAYLAHLAKCRADLHLQLAALERVRRDTNVPQEDYREDCPIPKNWQRNGKIELENVNVQPEPGAVSILNNINIAVQPGEKVAICGRSGSGKSTLLLTCVGATTICHGRVLVDGEDITRVPLRALRHRVVVVPQEPAMFSGTLRENLDPLAVHTDEEIWQCLRAVGLFEFVTAQTAGLECIVGGRNGHGGWSAGRVGRLGAARAALHARIASALLLDEPAAALDAPAERALLHAMAAVAPQTTIITVAHRVSSVRGYDRAVVLEAGSVVEQGTVSTLLAQPSSRLARMLANANRLT